MGFSYNKLPWVVRSAAPLLALAGMITYFHRIFNFNQLEYFGITFCVSASAFLVYSTLNFIYRNWVGAVLGHNTDLRKLGKWAVVTGATDGIGKAYAHALAKLGLDVVLISRSLDKLNQVATEIGELYGVETKVITADFTGGMEIYERIDKEIGELEISTLVNNVGMCYPYPEYFLDLPNGRKFCKDLINCNMLSVTMMTSIVLPGMVDRERGVVVNVGSISSKFDTPFMALYGSSKAFVDKFSQDLGLEYKEKGIIFQSLTPGYVVSNMSKVRASTLFVPTAEDFVDKAIKLIGLESSTAVWVPHQLIFLCIHVAQFFRREGAAEVCHLIGKNLWTYAKKVMIHRGKSG